MFLTTFRCGKAFSVEQKQRELKKIIFRLKAMEKSLSKKPNSYKKINKSVENMNSLPSGKDKQTPNEAEKDSLNLERSRERFNFLRLKKLEKKKLDKNF